MDNLTSGVDAILLKNIRLDYTDENNNARIKTLDKITLPVISSDGKITNQVSTDKVAYYEHENVSVFDRIHNNSDIRAAKGLTSVITIIDAEGNVIKEYSKPLSEIMTKSYAEVSETWNVADQPEGQYTIISNVYDGEVLVAESQAVIEVVHHELPQYELTGYLNTSGKLFKADETVDISRYIENIGRYDIENGTITIKIIDTKFSISQRKSRNYFFYHIYTKSIKDSHPVTKHTFQGISIQQFPRQDILHHHKAKQTNHFFLSKAF